MGSAIEPIRYDSESTTLLGGLTFKPADRWRLGIEAVWNDSQASMERFEIQVPPAFLAANPNSLYEFGQTHLFSDLELSRSELRASARFHLTPARWIDAGYRLIDVDDEAPYIEDFTGSIDLYSVALGWRF